MIKAIRCCMITLAAILVTCTTATVRGSIDRLDDAGALSGTAVASVGTT